VRNTFALRNVKIVCSGEVILASEVECPEPGGNFLMKGVWHFLKTNPTVWRWSQKSAISSMASSRLPSHIARIETLWIELSPRDLGGYEFWPNNCESSERD
jgi:hypothetical protein